jgi:hypothetical protein
MDRLTDNHGIENLEMYVLVAGAIVVLWYLRKPISYFLLLLFVLVVLSGAFTFGTPGHGVSFAPTNAQS